jgi:hypothetical protein
MYENLTDSALVKQVPDASQNLSTYAETQPASIAIPMTLQKEPHEVDGQPPPELWPPESSDLELQTMSLPDVEMLT